jgi:hypothetical protein
MPTDKPNPHNHRPLQRGKPEIVSVVFWQGAALLVGLSYLAAAAWGVGVVGFPLDDAWIHQTYARNLAQSGQFAFTPGVLSAGSTAPLWSLLLSVGYLLGVPFRAWTYILGMVCLGLTGWTARRLSARLFPESQRKEGLWVGLFCLLEWHLVWAAVSGMETILFTWLSLFLFERYLELQGQLFAEKQNRANFGLGILAGLLVLTRPEGLGLLGLIGLDLAYRYFKQPAKLLWSWIGLGAGAGLFLLPYIGLHYRLTGHPFPNTLYAKQAEYAVVLEAFPWWWRLFGNVAQPVESVQGVFAVIFIGAQCLLLPGLFYGGWLTFREWRWVLLPAWGWWISYLLLYGFNLPVTYQHGRYQIPAIPWVILLGVWGTARLLDKISPQRRLLRVAGRALVFSTAILLPVFTAMGAQAYGRDVLFIESEMVAIAHWLHEHTPPQATLAAHDIGAIGYFTRRPLLDLAGLVTPELIPIIRDERALLTFIRTRQADYLVTFPSWYPAMTQDPSLTPIYTTEAASSRAAGSDNMVVYEITPLSEGINRR